MKVDCAGSSLIGESLLKKNHRLLRRKESIVKGFYCRRKPPATTDGSKTVCHPEHDVLKGGFPIYHINRKIEETGMTFCDKSHILYVNGQYRGDDAIGRLMHDFSCADPDDMNSSVLAGKARYLKKDDKGASQMSIIMEELIAEEKREQAEKMAIGMIKVGKMSYDEISKVSDIPEERVRELAEQAAEPVLA